MKKALSIILGVILLISILVVPASASTAKREAMLEYNNIKITLDGKEITPKDANGNTVEPFTIDGSTYLPVRAVANALNLGVDWNGDTNTVILSSQSDTAITIFDAVLIEQDGVPRLTCGFFNNLSEDIISFDITIYCYDADKNPIMYENRNSFSGNNGTAIIKANGSHKIYWPLPNFPGTEYVEFAITAYKTEDNKVVIIPLAQQDKNSTKK